MISLKRSAALIACGAFALGTAACGSTSSGTSPNNPGGTITGAGSTFGQPVYQQWDSKLKNKQNITLNYQGVGSGAGIAQFTNKTVNMGATDIPMTDKEVSAANPNGQPAHIPTVFGSVPISWNLPGVNNLKLDGTTVADIFLGKVKTWNDPEIASQNPGVNLPSQPITVVHRSDSSGTSQDFTEFLSDVSPQWKSQVGTNKSPSWPTGTGGKGNQGVAAAIKQTPGAIGYVELAYALQNKFPTAQLKNKAGNYVSPNLQSTSAAGEGVQVPGDLRFSAVNSPNPNAYPIASATFVLVYQDMCKAGIPQPTAQNVANFLNFGLNQGQSIANQIDYASLSPAIKSQAQNKLNGLQCNGAPLKPSNK